MNITFLRNLSLNPVAIKISDNQNFEKIASFLDRPDFLRELTAIRRDLKIDKFYSRHEVHELIERDLQIAMDDMVDWEKAKNDLQTTKYQDIATRLQYKYKQGFHFQNVIFQALLCNYVNDDDLVPSAYFQRVTHKDFDPWVFNEPDSKIAIIINPQTTQKDVLDQYKKAMKDFKFRKLDTKPEITRDRVWFWQFIQGKSYRTIFKEQKGYKYSEEVIQKAIKAYYKRVTVEL